MVFVTGAAHGTDRTTVVAFAKTAASVALTAIDAAGSEVTAALIRDAGGNALIVNCNVTIKADITAALGQTVRDAGFMIGHVFSVDGGYTSPTCDSRWNTRPPSSQAMPGDFDGTLT